MCWVLVRSFTIQSLVNCLTMNLKTVSPESSELKPIPLYLPYSSENNAVQVKELERKESFMKEDRLLNIVIIKGSYCVFQRKVKVRYGMWSRTLE